MEGLIGNPLAIDILLILLVILDLVLSSICLLAPGAWYRIFHDREYLDPQGLLRRTGAVWAAFTLLQLVAFFRWEDAPYWLPLIAGVRLTELFSDWTYIAFAENLTWRGRVGLFVAPPGNLLFGWYLIASYLEVTGGA